MSAADAPRCPLGPEGPDRAVGQFARLPDCIAPLAPFQENVALLLTGHAEADTVVIEVKMFRRRDSLGLLLVLGLLLR